MKLAPECSGKGRTNFDAARVTRVIYYWAHPEEKNKSPEEIKRLTGFKFEPKGEIQKGDLQKIAKLVGVNITTVSAALKELSANGIIKYKAINGRNFVTTLPYDSKEAHIRKILYYWGHPDAIKTKPEDVERITGFKFKPQGKFSPGDMTKLAKETGIFNSALSKFKKIMEREGLL